MEISSNIFNPTTDVHGKWERGTFTVPEDVTDTRVQSVAHKYLRKFGEKLELQGFKVLEILGPVPSGGRMPAGSGRKRYDCFARVKRRPVTIELEIPDTLVPEMEKKGLKLK